MKKYFSLLLAAVVILMAACGGNNEEKEDGKLNIYTTVFPFESMIEQIGGEHVNVQSIYKNGTDIHSFEPTQKDTMRVAKSDLFIYSSDELDSVSKKISSVIKDKDKKLQLAAGIKDSELISGEHEHEHEHGEEQHNHGAHDPHVWLDPVLNKGFAKVIKDELVKKDKAHEKEYTANYEKLVKEIDKIDADMKKVTDHKKHDTVYISHDSLGYLAKRYNFKQEGVSGMNNEEPSQSSIINMINSINKADATYILYEQNIPSKTTDIIKEKTKAKAAPFHNMATLTSKDKQDITYQELMKHNIESLDKALNK